MNEPVDITSSSVTCDVGKYFSGVNSILIGDEDLDLFVFLGQPKDILDEYTEVTGKPQMPPLWSFGFWMSRITYFSEADGREVAKKLRDNQIPSDVIHFDTGWFETDWRCDYQFAESRFDDPKKMKWIDYQTGQVYNPGWNHIEAGHVPMVRKKNSAGGLGIRNQIIIWCRLNMAPILRRIFAGGMQQKTSGSQPPRDTAQLH